MILRPPEYLEDVRERELETQAAEARLHQLDQSLCPHCDYRIERDFVRCPELPAQAQGALRQLLAAARPGLDDLPLLRGRRAAASSHDRAAAAGGRRPTTSSPADARPGAERGPSRARPPVAAAEPRRPRRAQRRAVARPLRRPHAPHLPDQSSTAKEPMDRTLILVKPDAFARGLSGEIIARFERKGLRSSRCDT